MKARMALGAFVLLLGISTALAFSIATSFWGEGLVDLRTSAEGALLVHVLIEDGAADSEHVRDDLRKTLVDLLPQALRTIVDESRLLLDYVDSKDNVSGLIVDWSGDECVYVYADGSPRVTANVPLPIYSEFQESMQGFELTGIGWFVSFTEEGVASAFLSVRMATWASSAERVAMRLDTRSFWNEGLVEVELRDGESAQRGGIQFDTPGGTSDGAMARKIPDLLEGLSACVRQHLETFSTKELDDSFESLLEKESLHNLALYVLRPCKIGGRLVANCAMEHETLVNAKNYSPGTVPVGVGHLCYTIFGL